MESRSPPPGKVFVVDDFDGSQIDDGDIVELFVAANKRFQLAPQFIGFLDKFFVDLGWPRITTSIKLLFRASSSILSQNCLSAC